jgi:hypothetical protein
MGGERQQEERIKDGQLLGFAQGRISRIADEIAENACFCAVITLGWNYCSGPLIFTG